MKPYTPPRLTKPKRGQSLIKLDCQVLVHEPAVTVDAKLDAALPGLAVGANPREPLSGDKYAVLHVAIGYDKRGRERNVYYPSLETARKAVNDYFRRTKIMLSIVEVSKP